MAGTASPSAEPTVLSVPAQPAPPRPGVQHHRAVVAERTASRRALNPVRRAPRCRPACQRSAQRLPGCCCWRRAWCTLVLQPVVDLCPASAPLRWPSAAPTPCSANRRVRPELRGAAGHDWPRCPQPAVPRRYRGLHPGQRWRRAHPPQQRDSSSAVTATKAQPWSACACGSQSGVVHEARQHPVETEDPQAGQQPVQQRDAQCGAARLPGCSPLMPRLPDSAAMAQSRRSRRDVQQVGIEVRATLTQP